MHRRTDEGDIYFVANTSNVRHAVTATFRVDTSAAESWDPISGRTAPLPSERRAGGGTAVAFDLEPYGSRVIVFPLTGVPTPPLARSQPNATRPPSASTALDLSGGWNVRFQPGGPSIEMDRLRSWTDD